MARRYLSAILALILVAVPVSAVFAQDMMMGPLGVHDDPTYGSILTNSDGYTLYTFGADEVGVSNCSGNCATAWPPFLADEDMMMMSMDMGMDMDMMMMSTAGLGVIERDDGTYQFTWDGWPLYRFARDTSPGDVNGHGSGGGLGGGRPFSVVVVDPSMMM